MLHAVVVGMTGSGKTGLCVTLLEEAILDNIPAIVIDPKGDITNLALTFPGLQPQEFQPWVQPDDARRAGMDVPTYAADMAARWRDGLANWGIVPHRLQWMKGATEVSIYTPGSDAGLPISILASLRAPRQLNWQQHSELIRERINGIVTALYALAGMNVEPVKDAEHVLMSNIFEFNWQHGRDLTLQDIILQIQDPPFDKLGVFPIDQFMSEKKRYKLAMELNNIIAAPTFQSWLQGAPMDIQKLLYQDNGRPRVSIFYTAHLNDQERMFITTLILESMIGWMRTQRGTSSLRALLYIDEMFGYFPPYPKNPPTKEPILRLLKQARAFGIGLVLATQNPGDLDYKGLTNAGTWFIGRLQSDNDRKKVMDGLRQMASADENLDLRDVEDLIADIAPRVFLMRNVHNSGGPVMLHTRWAMSYLAGPLTRQQIGYLMQAQRQQLMSQIAQQQYVGNYQQPLQPQGWQQSYSQQQGYAQPGFNAQSYPQPGQVTGHMPPPPPGATSFGNMPPPPPGSTPYPQQGGFGAQSAPGFNAPPQQTPGFNQPAPGGFNSQAVTGATGGMAPVGQGGVLQTKPPVTAEIQEYFLPATLAGQQAIAQYQQNSGVNIGAANATTLAYKPTLMAQCA
ncbi:MAG: ATP-binding protein, partial [Aggregatilineales bacterium]